MKSTDYKRNEFVKRTETFIGSNVNMLKKVYGVSLVPLCSYDYDNLNRFVVALGKERDGPFTGMYNYFGGGLGDKSDKQFEDIPYRQRAAVVAKVLFEECFEEFGIILSARLFKKALLGVYEYPYRDGVTLVFICHICDVNPMMWEKTMMARRDIAGLDFKFQEMSKAKSMEFLKSDGKILYNYKDGAVSDYVRMTVYEVSKYVPLLSEKNRVKYDEFDCTDEYELY
jgi:hypothetical protein